MLSRLTTKTNNYFTAPTVFLFPHEDFKFYRIKKYPFTTAIMIIKRITTEATTKATSIQFKFF